jgi:ribosome-binding protein aMBF1 (putative translation factor)
MNFRQDWEPVVIKKFKEEKRVHFVDSSPKPIDLETKKIKRYTKELGDAIAMARADVKLSRVQLAHICNVVPALIADMETKGIYNADLCNKVCKFLKIKVDTRFS